MAITYPTAPAPVVILPATSTSTVNVTSGLATGAGSFQEALTNSGFGQQIVLPVATYTGEFTLPVPTGDPGGGGLPVTSSPAVTSRPAISTPVTCTSRPTATGVQQNFVTIISANHASLPADGTIVALVDASNMPTLVASNSLAGNQVISASAAAVHHYRFVGIKFTTPQVAAYQTAVRIAPVDATDDNSYPHHISFERCIMDADDDFGVTKGFEVSGKHIQYKDCYITNCKQLGQGDGNAIFGYTARGPYKIDNCHIEGMGEIVFFGSSLSGGIPVTAGYEYYGPADITITNTRLKRKLSWKRDHSTYAPNTDTAGSGTLSTVSAAVTFLQAHSFRTTHLAAQATTASTTLDLGVDPTANGFSSSGGYGWLAGTDYFKYGSTSGNTLTGVTGVGQTWAIGTWISPRSVFLQVPTISEKRRVINCADSTHATLESAYTAGNQTTVAFRYNSGELGCKGIFELKSGQRVLVENVVFENGWSDGQEVGGIQLTAREYGWFSDIEIKYCKLINCSGLGVGVGDPGNSRGFGSSPRGTNRVWLHQLLLKDQNSTEAISLASNPNAITLPLNTAPYGTLSSVGGYIKSDGTTGSVTFTATGAQFDSSIIKTDDTWEMWLCDGTNTPIGKATVTGVGGTTTMTGTVTSTFDSTATTANSGSGPLALFWRLGPSAYVNSRYSMDSIVLEHITLAGASVGHTRAITVSADEGTFYEPVQDVTNFVLRNNILHAGVVPNSGNGLQDQYNSDVNNVASGAGYTKGDTNLITHYLDSSKVIDKNVWIGTHLISGNTDAQYYNDPVVGPSSSHANMFHQPDHTVGDTNATYGGTCGAVGFTDHDNGDFTITGTYATAATDGTMIGCDIAALNARLANVN